MATFIYQQILVEQDKKPYIYFPYLIQVDLFAKIQDIQVNVNHHLYNSQIQIMHSYKLVLTIALLLLTQIASYPLISQTIPNFNMLSYGNKPIRVTRYHTVRYTYQPVGRWLWINYPEFNDRIQIDTAQYVRISYSITVNFWPICTNLLTRLLINNKIQQRYTTVTSNQYERTNAAAQWVWLQPGNYILQLQYMIGENVPLQKAGDIDWMTPYFEIEYFKNAV